MSAIEWTNETWNPVTGCSRVSAGCDNCYAVTMSHRLGAMAATERRQGKDPGRKSAYGGLTVLNGKGHRHFNGTVRCNEDALSIPLGWKKPRKVFVNSMSDLFHPKVPFEFIDRVFAVMALCPQHTFQILTKRPERAAEYLAECDVEGLRMAKGTPPKLLGDRISEHIAQHAGIAPFRLRDRWPLPNVWLGASVENQEQDERIRHLLNCPAYVRFLSCEPLLGPVDLMPVFNGCPKCGSFDCESSEDAAWCESCRHTITPEDGIDWVIVGGESGPRARPMHPDWARSIRDQCAAAGVPFFFKQWGEYGPTVTADCMAEYARAEASDAEIRESARLDRVVHRDGRVERPEANDEWWGCASRHWDEEYGDDPMLMRRVGKKKAGRTLDGRTWDEYPMPGRSSVTCAAPAGLPEAEHASD